MARLNTPFPSHRIKRIWRGTLIGVVSGLGGIVFNLLLQWGTRLFSRDLVSLIVGPSLDRLILGFPASRWMMMWIPALGGLIAGLIVFTFAPEAEGHGTDAMIDSFSPKERHHQETGTGYQDDRVCHHYWVGRVCR
jgi:chloride channel protein, CIC family